MCLVRSDVFLARSSNVVQRGEQAGSLTDKTVLSHHTSPSPSLTFRRLAASTSDTIGEHDEGAEILT